MYPSCHLTCDLRTHEPRVLRVSYDPDSPSPRTWDADGETSPRLYTWMRGHASPDENPYDDPSDFLRAALEDAFGSENDLRQAMQAEAMAPLGDVADNDPFEAVSGQTACACRLIRTRAALVPIYALDHSGVTYSTTPFGDPWDSGLVGWGYLSPEAVRLEFGDASDDSLEDACGRVEADVVTWAAWAEGEVFAAEVRDLDGDVVDSCGGFLGYDTDDGLLRSMAECLGLDAGDVRELSADDPDEACDEARELVEERIHQAVAGDGKVYVAYAYTAAIPVSVTVLVPEGTVAGTRARLDAFVASDAFAREVSRQRAGAPMSGGTWSRNEVGDDTPPHVSGGDVDRFANGSGHFVLA